jgi:purine-binding chemotaxis protein CheW
MSEKDIQVVIFSLASKFYAIEIDLVQEINKKFEITKVHNGPEFVMGIINLRGQIVTTLDLKHKFQLGENVITSNSRLIIVKWDDEFVGIFADAVEDILQIKRESILEVPANINSELKKNIKNIIQHGDTVVELLHVDAIMM